MATSSVENLAPNVIRKISKELAELVKQPPEGIKLLANEEDLTDIQAIIDGPAGTPYAQGSFKVKLVLGKGFPGYPPRGYFITKIFHPNVSSSGEICVNTLNRDWNEDLGIKDILLVIKCLLIVPNADSALNDEAAKLLQEHYSEYCARAKMMTEIHAKKAVDKSSTSATNNAAGVSSSRSALSTSNRKPAEGGPKVSKVKKQTSIFSSVHRPVSTSKMLKDKKRMLKRL